LRRQLWTWPIIAAVLLGGVGWWVSRSVEEAMRLRRVEELQTILDADVQALHIWMAEQAKVAELIAADESLRPMVQELLKLAGTGVESERALLQAKAQDRLRFRLQPRLERYGYVGLFIVSPSGVVIAADQDAPVGKPLDSYRKEFFAGILTGQAAVSKPFRSPLLLKDEKGELRTGLPTMFAAASILDEAGRPLAALGLRIRPEAEFTRILQVARSGETGETYAFDQKGVLLSESRFDEELKQIGLLVDQPDSRSVLTLELRDPGVDMTEGERPHERHATLPLTRCAAEAVEGRSGYDVEGYRDYRGAAVIGAWTWLPEFEFGVATQIDVAEAFVPLYILRRAVWVLMGLLLVSAVGIFFAMLFMTRQHRLLQDAVIQARHLGQYTLEKKLGAGGMGTVYLARHAMLRRATAVKLLDPDKLSAATVVRFEREVQLTSGLTHPNTVAIFDFGRTPEGVFYYAMEYLEGVNLEQLVSRHGPLTEARAVYILRQVCGSLAEAHAAGLVHRDVKPANIFLTCRGGLHDFVKVLDFGLVKSVGGGAEASVTAAAAVTGTPLYLSPEAITEPDRIDARADVYSLGGVAYYLLTGTPVFNGASLVDICMKHTQTAPEHPSSRLGRAIAPALEALILRCLAKSRSERPADAAALLHELTTCSFEGQWTTEDAAGWWAKHAAGAPPNPSSPGPMTPTTVNRDFEATIAHEGE
jgi:hypothetical protein